MWFECQLAKRKKVRMGALVDAMIAHYESRAPIGRLALQRRKLSMKQIFEVLAQQAGNDKPFGQAAMELGYLTEGDIAELLKMQSDLAQPVGELLVEAGAISREAYDVELARFRASITDAQFDVGSRSAHHKGTPRCRPSRQLKKRTRRAAV